MRLSPTRATGTGRAVAHRAVLDDAPAAARPSRWARLARPLLVTLLALALLGALGLQLHSLLGPPATLDRAVLEGDRKVTGPVCIDEAQDVSGSMEQYTALRERAVAQLFEFAKRELRPEDQLAEAVFSGAAGLTLPPTRLHTLSPLRRPPPTPANGTMMAPAVRVLTAADRGATGDCAARALVVITDGELHDEPDELRTALRDAAYTRVYAVVPGWIGSRPAIFHGDVLGGTTVRRFHDAERLGVIFGEVFAELTGERLAQRPVDRTTALAHLPTPEGAAPHAS
ncbi:vWA domain-containing protein [Micromonospora echinofusca]|uniref:vWA domain-containing protein n=1 Tax=Micromonospora echinofusca TaxID=47858 RepID=UPI00340C700B